MVNLLTIQPLNLRTIKSTSLSYFKLENFLNKFIKTQIFTSNNWSLQLILPLACSCRLQSRSNAWYQEVQSFGRLSFPMVSPEFSATFLRLCRSWRGYWPPWSLQTDRSFCLPSVLSCQYRRFQPTSLGDACQPTCPRSTWFLWSPKYVPRQPANNTDLGITNHFKLCFFQCGKLINDDFKSLLIKIIKNWPVVEAQGPTQIWEPSWSMAQTSWSLGQCSSQTQFQWWGTWLFWTQWSTI